MKRSTAISRLASIAEECAQLTERIEMFGTTPPVSSFWTFGPVLDGPDAWPADRQAVEAALVFDAPEADVYWYARPRDLTFAADLLGWSKRPVHLMFRSAAAPVWNHHIVRPLLLWDAETGLHEDAIAALRSGDVEALRDPARSEAELRDRLLRECEVSFEAMRSTTATYDDKRWARGNPRPHADAMWEASAGYVDLRTALRGLEPPADRTVP